MLNKILDTKRAEISRLDPAEWKHRAADCAAPRGFLPPPEERRVGRNPRASVPQPRLIAEIKRASPSRGVLAAGLDPLAMALTYAENGAAALSILTDEPFFHGSAETLTEVRRLSPADSGGRAVPLLRKDFILAPVQVHQTRALGADAMLLILAALPEHELLDLHALALELGLAPLVEVHDEAELERALRIPALRWAGINNRNLATFAVSLDTTRRLAPMVPPGICVVAESGIFTAADARAAGAAGADAILVGEALVTAADTAAKVRELAQTEGQGI